jgi:hypothetical protein
MRNENVPENNKTELKKIYDVKDTWFDWIKNCSSTIYCRSFVTCKYVMLCGGQADTIAI